MPGTVRTIERKSMDIQISAGSVWREVGLKSLAFGPDLIWGPFCKDLVPQDSRWGRWSEGSHRSPPSGSSLAERGGAVGVESRRPP